MAGRVAGKVALVMGAGSVGEGWGNGKACATLYAREGASVFAVDVRSEAAEETRAIIAGEGGTCVARQADATDGESVAAAVAACVAAFGRVDILHNNVGGSVPGDPVTMDPDDWDREMTFNLKTMFLACKHAIPVMLDHGGGAIVSISSVAGIRHIGRDVSGYMAAKAGMQMLSKSIALKYAKQGIRSNCILPGLMHTPLVEARVAAQAYGGDVARAVAERAAQCPMGRMGDAWDVAYAALYLASDEAKYVTATEIVVDGGLTARC
jgi:NAD(P)-dependent dehydrogenase (short-subunit alcohol dehydrogenase family)